MMMDNDFPTKLGGDKNTVGFLQQYVSGMQDYSQTGENIPDLGVRQEYEQEQGGPLISRTIRYTPPNAIIKVPHLDSPYMDQLIERGYKPLQPPGPRGPQLPSFI